MMNLCFVTHSMDLAEGGQSLAALCEGLAARGHRVSLIAPGGPLAERLGSHKAVALHVIPALHERSPRGLLRAAVRLSRLLKGIDPEVIDCRSFRLLPSVTLACRLAGCRARICLSVQGLERSHQARLIGSGVAALAHDACTSSAETRRRLRESGMPRQLGEVIYPGIDREWLRPLEEVEQRRLPGENGVVRLGTLGRLIELAGHQSLLEALASLKFSTTRFQLDVGGDGPQQDRLEAYARKLGLTGLVRFHGHHPDPRALLDRLDLLVIPSIRETFPTLVLEAMARGTPILSAALHGVPEAVHEGRTGFLYPAGQVDALARVLERIAGELEHVREARRNARELVEQRFLTEHMVSAHERWFMRVVRGE